MKNDKIYIDNSNTNFKCPHCSKKYSDKDNEYLIKCNRNKSNSTSIRCECGYKFGMTYNTMGDAISFITAF